MSAAVRLRPVPSGTKCRCRCRCRCRSGCLCRCRCRCGWHWLLLGLRCGGHSRRLGRFGQRSDCRLCVDRWWGDGRPGVAPRALAQARTPPLRRWRCSRAITANAHRLPGNRVPETARSRSTKIVAGARAAGADDESIGSAVWSFCSDENARSATSVASAPTIDPGAYASSVAAVSAGNDCRETSCSCSGDVGRVGKATSAFGADHNACLIF